MLATILKTSELAINEEEAKQLADALNEVNSLYDFSVIPPSVMAWINLAMVAGTIYVPRFVVIKVNGGTAQKPKQPIVINAQ